MKWLKQKWEKLPLIQAPSYLVTWKPHRSPFPSNAFSLCSVLKMEVKPQQRKISSFKSYCFKTALPRNLVSINPPVVDFLSSLVFLNKMQRTQHLGCGSVCSITGRSLRHHTTPHHKQPFYYLKLYMFPPTP